LNLFWLGQYRQTSGRCGETLSSPG
jgi:hypothetical protein